jgi:ABC-type polysaccharide/polyol phosphate export permease
MDTIQTIEKLKEVFAPIAEKIGQGAQYGWEIVIKQQYVTAYIGIFWAIIGLIAIILSIIAIKYGSKHENELDGELMAVIIMISIILIISGTTGIIAGSITAITHLINPDYYAIQFFLNLANN